MNNLFNQIDNQRIKDERVKDLEFNWESQETTPIRIPQQKIIQIKNYEHSK
jgi:hypothetical protein